jgi:hypothetical protein
LIWTPLAPDDVRAWIAGQRGRPAPDVFRLEDPAETAERLGDRIGDFVTVRPDSGTLDFDFGPIELDDWIAFLGAALEAVDPERRLYQWEDLSEEELGASAEHPRAVVEEYLTSINGVSAVGPGGRITTYRHGGRISAEISVRGRRHGISSSWRHPTEIAAEAVAAFEEAPSGTRLRVAFGYYEASKYERQEWLRPAFVFLLDRPETEDGPRWRVAFVERATESDELPPTAGLENASGGCA